MNQRIGRRFWAGFLVAAMWAYALPVRGQQVFFDDFESGLGQWVGKNGGAYHALTVTDPVSSGHGSVLTFTALNEAGDIFTTALFSGSGPLRLSFDYMGNPSLGAGFLGIAYSLNPGLPGVDHFWLAGTLQGYGPVDLTDDGAWHHYSIDLNAVMATFWHEATISSFHIILEDFDQAGGVVGNSFFDNVSLVVVPEPSATGLLCLGLLALLWPRFRFARHLKC